MVTGTNGRRLGRRSLDDAPRERICPPSRAPWRDHIPPRSIPFRLTDLRGYLTQTAILVQGPLRPRMRLRVRRLHLLDRHVGINSRRYQRRMPQQPLNHPDIGATVSHVRRPLCLNPWDESTCHRLSPKMADGVLTGLLLPT